MTVEVNDAGTWKASVPYVNDGGTWKAVTEVWVNDNGTWKSAYSSGPATLDTQTVTAGGAGTAGNQDRTRGWISGMGSISDGTSNIYGGASVTQAQWLENGGTADQLIRVSIAGATNSGWTTLTIKNGGTTVATLTRASASFGSGTWTWSFAAGTYTATSNPFGAIGQVRTLEFT